MLRFDEASVLPDGERDGLPTIGASGGAEPEASDKTGLTQQTASDRRRPRRFAAVDGWRGFGWLVCGGAGSLAIAWFVFLSPGEIGSKAEWFFGAVVFVVVMVSMWQTLTIQRQAKQDAVDAAERLRNELTAAEERSIRQLALMQTMHRTEIEAQRELARVEIEAQRETARVEIEAQRELARTQRTYLLEQQQKQAVIAVSRAVSAHTHILATLWNQGASILHIEDRDERDEAMQPVFEQIGQVVNDFSVEIANAHLLIHDERLHQALNRINDAVLMAIRVAEDVHVAVVDGHAPHPNPIPSVQLLMHQRAAEARHLAWDLLRTCLDTEAPTE